MVSSTDALPTGAEHVGGPPPRGRRLAERLNAVRDRARSGNLDRGLLIAGGLLMPLGVLLVAIGWLGASHTVLTFEQISYLISGGLIGIALVVAGGFIYFTYWQALLIRNVRAYHEDLRAHHLRLTGSMERIEGLLRHDASVGLVGTGTTEALVATATGTMLHRSDCSVVTGRPNLRLVTTATPGLKPCAICRPLTRRDTDGADDVSS